jgi:uncharacterized protein (TIGR03435 family)
MMLAMRTLLADRFKLKVRKEIREMDIYALVMSRPGGKPGPALKVSTDMCGQRQGIGAPRPDGGAPAAPPTRPDGTPIFCGMRQQPGRVQFNGMPLTQFASGIAQRVGRAVVDRTGLTGEWSFELTFAPQAGQLPPGVELPAVDPNTPDLFTAVQEQLGLKLEATKGPVEVLVVESIDRPVADGVDGLITPLWRARVKAKAGPNSRTRPTLTPLPLSPVPCPPAMIESCFNR